MNKKINVLVDGVGGDVGQGVLKSLRETTLDIELYASCISNTSSWLYKIDNSFIFPFVSDEKYIEHLIDFIRTYKIDVYFPTIDSSLLKIASYKKYIEEETSCIVFIDDLEKIEICDDKYKTILFLNTNGYSAPLSIECGDKNKIKYFIEQQGFPLVQKSKRGNGAKEVNVINYSADLDVLLDDNWMLQEYLDIEYEITSGIYIGDDKKVKYIYVLQRELRCGSTYKAQIIIDNKLNALLEEIALSMDMKYINIQAVYKNEKLYPFEFNGRMSGTTGAMCSIFNVAENFIKERVLKKKIDLVNVEKNLYLSRYYEEVLYNNKDIEKLENRSVLNV